MKPWKAAPGKKGIMSTAAQAFGDGTPRWYLKVGDQNHGPYGRDEIARYLGEGRISPHSLLAREGSDDWRIARDDPDLAPLFGRRVGSAAPPPQTAPSERDAALTIPALPDTLWAHIAYGLYASLLLGVSAPLVVIAVILAHVNRDGARGTWLESHYLWQIRTFWIALPVTLVGSFTTIFLIGWVFLGAAWLWVVYRAIKGWLLLYREEAIRDPKAFL